jgi:hypothetical protein
MNTLPPVLPAALVPPDDRKMLPPTPLVAAAPVIPADGRADQDVVENALTCETVDGLVGLDDDEAV